MLFGQEHETSIVSQSLLMLRKDLKLLGRRMTGDEWKTLWSLEMTFAITPNLPSENFKTLGRGASLSSLREVQGQGLGAGRGGPCVQTGPLGPRASGETI